MSLQLSIQFASSCSHHCNYQFSLHSVAHVIAAINLVCIQLLTSLQPSIQFASSCSCHCSHQFSLHPVAHVIATINLVCVACNPLMNLLCHQFRIAHLQDFAGDKINYCSFEQRSFHLNVLIFI